MKASVLIYEKLNFAPVVYMLKGLKKRNLKRVKVNKQASGKQTKMTNLAG